ncbi:MAG: hypothetical protein ACD_4C00466G0003 [uncultured bacterium (gcode 4)]|uniref:Uncharacterized protein n=1 Tax=uncultured bacterium (gcode 4) TaxID=1234023 RepID=K2G7H3_9BACT|nr:MAG: hypothetical protein ACD_4C00466G0003 [uncultured bacterium (gcode 4)]
MADIRSSDFPNSTNEHINAPQKKELVSYYEIRDFLKNNKWFSYNEIGLWFYTIYYNWEESHIYVSKDGLEKFLTKVKWYLQSCYTWKNKDFKLKRSFFFEEEKIVNNWQEIFNDESIKEIFWSTNKPERVVEFLNYILDNYTNLRVVNIEERYRKMTKKKESTWTKRQFAKLKKDVSPKKTTSKKPKIMASVDWLIF